MKLDDTIEVLEKLTKSEKRFISITISRMSKSEGEPTEQHFQLYNLLTPIIKEAEKAKPADKDSMEARLEKQKAFVAERIDEEKKQYPKLFTSLNVIRLYDFIFSTLRLKNADKPEYKLDNYIQDIQTLQSKGLEDQALRLIEKAKKEAEEEEKFMSDLKILQFLMLERRTHLTTNKAKDDDDDAIKKLTQSCGEQYERIKYILDTMQDQEVVQHYSRQGKIPDEVINEMSPVFTRLLNEPEFFKSLPLDAALRGLNNTVLYLSRDRTKHEKAFFEDMPKQAQRMIELFKDKELRKSRNPESYLKSILVLANSCIKIGKRKVFESHLHEFKQALGIDPGRPIEEEITKITIDKHTSRVQYNLIFLFTSYYIGIGDLDTALRIVEHIKEAIKVNKVPLLHHMALNYLMASVYTITKDYAAARIYVDKLLASPKGVRGDIVLQARLLDILLVYEGQMEETVQQKIGTLITELSQLGNGKKSPYIQDMIQDARAILTTLLNTFSSLDQGANLEEFVNLDKKLTKGTGEFITDVFALWARQKI